MIYKRDGFRPWIPEWLESELLMCVGTLRGTFKKKKKEKKDRELRARK